MTKHVKKFLTLGGCAALALGATATSGAPADAAGGAARHDYVTTVYAAVGHESKPDDITRLGNHIYVAFQNGVSATGAPATDGTTFSTIQQYGLDGRPGRSWNVVGRVDGMCADPANNRILATTNEDGNSSFHVVRPNHSGVRDYAYENLTHGGGNGGTDACHVVNGVPVVTASHPSSTSDPMAYAVRLHGSKAQLSPLLLDNATATVLNADKAGQKVQLGIADADSNTLVPTSVPRLGGQFMVDGSADKQLVFVKNVLGASKSISVLSIGEAADDTAFATSGQRVLWVADQTNNTVDRITGPFTAGEAITSVGPHAQPTYLARLNLSTGALTPISQLAWIHPKGILFTSNR